MKEIFFLKLNIPSCLEWIMSFKMNFEFISSLSLSEGEIFTQIFLKLNDLQSNK